MVSEGSRRLREGPRHGPSGYRATTYRNIGLLCTKAHYEPACEFGTVADTTSKLTPPPRPPVVEALPPPAPAPSPSGMVALPGGTFTMGERKDTVTVQPFLLDVTEVTADAYAACVRAGAVGGRARWGSSGGTRLTGRAARGTTPSTASTGIKRRRTAGGEEASAHGGGVGVGGARAESGDEVPVGERRAELPGVLARERRGEPMVDVSGRELSGGGCAGRDSQSCRERVGVDVKQS